jgi:hypothetical protein
MMLGDETDLARGRTRRVDNEMGLDQGLGGKRSHQGAAGFILADDADENAASPEAGNVARDVARAADGKIIARHRQDRSRGFGRNTRDFAVDEIIKHQVSDADDGLLGNELDHFFEVEHRAIA